MNKAILLFALFFTAISAQAQYDINIPRSNYLINPSWINPAHYGMSFRGNVGIYTFQGIQSDFLDGNESAFTLMEEFQLPNEKSGIGFRASMSQNSYDEVTDISLGYSYHIKWHNGNTLSFGSALHGNRQNFDYTQITGIPERVTDYGIGLDLSSFYQGKKFTIGLNYTNALNRFTINSESRLNILPRYLYLYSSYLANMNESWVFKPTMMINTFSDVLLRVEPTASFIVKEKINFGLGARINSVEGSSYTGFRLHAGYTPNKNFGGMLFWNFRDDSSLEASIYYRIP